MIKRNSVNLSALTGTLMALGSTLVGCSSAKQQPPQSPASAQNVKPADDRAKLAGPTAEQQRAVDAFAGQWLFSSTITPPGGAPVRADLTMTCTKTAGGRAAVCTMGGEVPGMGPMDAGILIGVDRLDNKVHFMAMTSDDELHDHVCVWRDAKNLACEPLQAGLGGQLVTEDLSFAFDGDQGSFKSVIRMADGTQMLFDAPGRRVSALPPRGPSAGKAPATSAEQKKLVEKFLGSWTWDAEIVLPNSSRLLTKLHLECQATAGGKASLCSLGASDIAGRPYEAAILVGHDPYDKSVHFMMMSSDDEVWHRTCAWKGTKLACAPMDTSVLGMKAKTEVTLDFASTLATTRWDTLFADGKTCSLNAKMRRP